MDVKRLVTCALVVAGGLALIACGGGGETVAPSDNGDPGDTTPSEPALPLDGFGDLSGDCDVLNTLVLDSIRPAVYENAIDFGSDPFDATDYARLTSGGQRLYDAGGGEGETLAEVFAFEVLHRCERAELEKTGGEVAYEGVGGAQTDFVVRVWGRRVGVAVARGYSYPPTLAFTKLRAKYVLTQELEDVLASTANVAAEDAWTKQILCVLVDSTESAQSVRDAYRELDDALRADTVLLITVTDGDDGFVYGF